MSTKRIKLRFQESSFGETAFCRVRGNPYPVACLEKTQALAGCELPGRIDLVLTTIKPSDSVWVGGTLREWLEEKVGGATYLELDALLDVVARGDVDRMVYAWIEYEA